MEEFEQIAAKYFQPEGPGKTALPPTVVGAVNKSGSFQYLKNLGSDSEPDGVHFIASATKVVATIAALQCVEKGLLELDGDIAKVLPEFKDVKILVGFEGDGKTPILKPSTKPITLRHLLTHNSGLTYEFISPLLKQYREVQGREFSMSFKSWEWAMDLLLVHEPGELWEYSVGIDWAGRMVERVNGGMKLGEYIRLNILDPIGAKDFTFHLEDREDMRARLKPMYMRGEDGKLQPVPHFMADPVPDDFGGAGAYAAAGTYLKILAAILRQDSKILGKETFEMMFTPQLKDTAGMIAMRDSDPTMARNMFGSCPTDTPLNFGIGGMTNLASTPNGRHANALAWSGMPNCYWWVDPKGEVAAVYMSQLLPSGDAQAVELLGDFERAIYAHTGTLSAESV